MGAINRSTRAFNKANKAHDVIVAGILARYPQAFVVRSIDQDPRAASTIIALGRGSAKRVYVGAHGGTKIGVTKAKAKTVDKYWKDLVREWGKDVLATK